LVLLREQGFLDDHQVGQGEQGVQLRGVLLEAAIAQILMAEQVLDDMERVYLLSPAVRVQPVRRRRTMCAETGQVAVPRRLFVDILSLIARLRAPPALAWGGNGSKCYSPPPRAKQPACEWAMI
jgi:hypothetical protein